MKSRQSWKLGAVLVGVTIGFSAFAAEEPKIEITSFVPAGTRTRAAELCGKITGVNVPYLAARVVVDDKTDKPGIYNVLVGKDGHFCTTVVSYAGTASASVWLLGKELVSNSVNWSKQGPGRE